MIRWLSRLLVLTAVGLFACFLFFVTPAGLDYSAKWLQRQLPGKLTYQSLNGNIFGPINISGLHYESEDWVIDAQRAHLEWRLPMLLFRHLDIANLRANRIIVVDRRHPVVSNGQPLQPKKLSLPFSLSIEQADLKNLQYRPATGKHDIRIKQLSFNKFTLTRHKIHGDVTLQLKKPYQVTNYLSLDGELSSYRFNWTLVKQHERLYVTGHGNRGSAYIFLNRNKLFGGSLHGKIQFSWYPFITWNVHLDLKQLALGRFDPTLPKIDTASIHSVGIWEDTLPRFNCDAILTTGSNRLSVIGAFNTAWNIHWNAKLNDLHQLHHTLYGKILSQGSVFGDRNKPLVKATLSVANAELGANTLSELNAQVLLDLAQRQPSSFQLTASQVHLPKIEARTLSVRSTATQDFSHLHLAIGLSNATTQNLRLETDLQGVLHPNEWRGQLQRLQLSSDEIGVWQTLRPSALNLAFPSFDLQATQLSSPLGEVAFSLSNHERQWRIQSHGSLKNLNSVARILSKYLTISSAAQFNFSANGKADNVQAVSADFTAAAGRIDYARNSESLTIPFKQMNIHTKTQQQDLVTTIKAVGEQQDQLTVSLTFKQLLDQLLIPKEHPISGGIEVRFSKLKLLQFFIPEISEPTGVVAGQLTLSGTIENPSLKGDLSLKDGQVDIPSLKVQLDNVKLDLSAEKQKVTYHAVGSSQGQVIHANGTTDFSGDGIESVIKLTGTNVLIMNTHEYTIYANANLVLRMKGQIATLSGDIFIPRAVIKPSDFSTTVTLSDDFELLRGEQPIEKSTWLWYYNLNISLGDDIVVDSFGLKGRLEGAAVLTSSPQQPNVIATGQLRLVDATYTTQGKQLSIEPNSYINYSHDPLKNPHLNIRMSRTVIVLLSSDMSPIGPSETTVGIDVKGTVKRPKITMFSRPMTLSQADIISYLLFDQAASGGANIGVILQAVQSLKFGGKSDTSTLSKIQQSLGIAEIGVQQQMYVDAFGTPFGVNQSGFVVGRYITPHVYVRYTHGLVTAIDIYQLRYIINKNWAIQAETGSQQIGNGLDLLYTVSRKHFPW